MVTDLMWETMALIVIGRPACAIVELNVIIKIYKYIGLYEGHHFIPMIMEVHNAPECDMDRFFKECARLFHNRWLRGHLFLSFCIQFLRQHVNIVLQHALTFVIVKKIALTNDVYSKPPITIRCHNLHARDIRKTMNKIASYLERD